LGKLTRPLPITSGLLANTAVNKGKKYPSKLLLVPSPSHNDIYLIPDDKSDIVTLYSRPFKRIYQKKCEDGKIDNRLRIVTEITTKTGLKLLKEGIYPNEKISKVIKGVDHTVLRYAVNRGTQMGLRMSFPVLCLLHLFATRHRPNASVFGDDLIARWGSNEISDYLGRMHRLGFKMNDDKTFISKTRALFCGCWFKSTGKRIRFPDIKTWIVPKVEKDMDDILRLKEVYMESYVESNTSQRKIIRKMMKQMFSGLLSNIDLPLFVPEEFGGFGLRPYNGIGNPLSVEARNIYAKLGADAQRDWTNQVRSQWATAAAHARIREISSAITSMVESSSSTKPRETVKTLTEKRGALEGLENYRILAKDVLRPTVQEVTEPLIGKVLSDLQYTLNDEAKKSIHIKYRYKQIRDRVLTKLGHLIIEGRKTLNLALHTSVDSHKPVSNGRAFIYSRDMLNGIRISKKAYKKPVIVEKYVPIEIAQMLHTLLDVDLQSMINYIASKAKFDLGRNTFLNSLIDKYGLQLKKSRISERRLKMYLDGFKSKMDKFAEEQADKDRKKSIGQPEPELSNVFDLRFKIENIVEEDELKLSSLEEFPPLGSSSTVPGTAQWIYERNKANVGKPMGDRILNAPFEKPSKFVNISEFLKKNKIDSVKSDPNLYVYLPRNPETPIKLKYTNKNSGLSLPEIPRVSYPIVDTTESPALRVHPELSIVNEKKDTTVKRDAKVYQNYSVVGTKHLTENFSSTYDEIKQKPKVSPTIDPDDKINLNKYKTLQTHLRGRLLDFEIRTFSEDSDLEKESIQSIERELKKSIYDPPVYEPIIFDPIEPIPFEPMQFEEIKFDKIEFEPIQFETFVPIDYSINNTSLNEVTDPLKVDYRFVSMEDDDPEVQKAINASKEDKELELATQLAIFQSLDDQIYRKPKENVVVVRQDDKPEYLGLGANYLAEFIRMNPDDRSYAFGKLNNLMAEIMETFPELDSSHWRNMWAWIRLGNGTIVDLL
jgi:hypothetical protein